MMSQSQPPEDAEPCPECGVMLMVEGAPLFTKVRCPGCGAEVRIRRKSGVYLLLEVLGQGGSGRVFRARAESEEQDVALKVLEKGMPDFDGHLELLRNEAASAGMVSHPRIVKVLGIERDGEGARLVMELMEGGSLHDLIGDRGKIGEEHALRIVLEALKGLSAAHAKGIIHRDLKPANILLSASGGAKLSDFGLALSTVAMPVAEPHLLATPDYVAPEILAGFRGDERSDIYSVGGCLFHALTGAPPYATDGLSIQELRLLKAKPARFPEGSFSPAAKRLVIRMLDPDPARRFRSLGEVEAGILSALDSGAGWGASRTSLLRRLGTLLKPLLGGNGG